MPFIGRKPTNAPLVSSDLGTGIVGSTNIADGTITNDDIDASAAIAQSKIAGSFGKVLQVVQATKTDTTTLSASFADTGITASITPSSASNKILIICQITATSQDPGGNTIGSYLRLLRNSTDISQGTSAGSRTVLTTEIGGSRGADDSNNGSIMFLDSPNTTSATTYKIQACGRNQGGGGIFYLNRSISDSDANTSSRGTSNIILLEIAG